MTINKEKSAKILIPNSFRKWIFYMFKPKGILNTNNRLHSNIGYVEMERYKMYQIDDYDDIPVVEYFLNKHNIN